MFVHAVQLQCNYTHVLLTLFPGLPTSFGGYRMKLEGLGRRRVLFKCTWEEATWRDTMPGPIAQHTEGEPTPEINRHTITPYTLEAATKSSQVKYNVGYYICVKGQYLCLQNKQETQRTTDKYTHMKIYLCILLMIVTAEYDLHTTAYMYLGHIAMLDSSSLTVTQRQLGRGQ